VQGKSEMRQPIAIATHLKIPFFAIFDSDSEQLEYGEKKFDDANTQAKYDGNKSRHELDNKAILTLCNASELNPFPKTDYWYENLVMWVSDIGKVVTSEIDNWEHYRNKANEEYGQVGGLNKNSLFIATALTLAWEDGKISQTLEKLCRKIIERAQREKARPENPAGKENSKAATG
jgi:hypothetical protein